MRCKTTKTSTGEKIARQTYTMERSGESTLVAATRALGTSSKRLAHRQTRFDVAVVGAEAVLLELWQRVLSVDGKDATGNPFTPLPAAPQPRKTKGKGAAKAPSSTSSPAGGSFEGESVGATQEQSVTADAAKGGDRMEVDTDERSDTADTTEDGDQMAVDYDNSGRASGPNEQTRQLSGHCDKEGTAPSSSKSDARPTQARANDPPVARITATGKGVPGKLGTDWVKLGKLGIEVRLRAMPLGYHHSHKEGEQLCPKEGYNPFASPCWKCAPPIVQETAATSAKSGRGRGKGRGRGNSKGKQKAKSGPSQGQGTEAGDGTQELQAKKWVTLVAYAADWSPTTTKTTFAADVLCSSDARGDAADASEDTNNQLVIVVARCGHWFHADCFEGIGSVCPRCEARLYAGWQKTANDLEKNLSKAVSEHLADVHKPIGDGTDKEAGSADLDGAGDEGLEAYAGDASAEDEVDSAAFKNAGEQLLPSAEAVATMADQLRQRFTAQSALGKAAIANLFA